uniref:F-box domain-containing protein n=1 Tax=Leersia perrieri TaxID=77586 RepID=A0A0D9X070_9ORYZ
MASPDQPVPHPLQDPEQPRQLPALTDELLEEIFLRIGSPAEIVRTSAACVSFRRLITDRHFLRRYRSFHRPLLLGFVHLGGFEPAQPPHSSAPIARALASAADFSFAHLPPGRWPKGWHPCHSRDGLVLLECSPVQMIHAASSRTSRHTTLCPGGTWCSHPFLTA